MDDKGGNHAVAQGSAGVPRVELPIKLSAKAIKEVFDVIGSSNMPANYAVEKVVPQLLDNLLEMTTSKVMAEKQWAIQSLINVLGLNYKDRLLAFAEARALNQSELDANISMARLQVKRESSTDRITIPEAALAELKNGKAT